jgi:hypothetical protein
MISPDQFLHNFNVPAGPVIRIEMILLEDISF